MISCLCVTRGDRLPMLANAVADFAGQTYRDRELVIVHDGDSATHDAILTVAANHAACAIRVRHVPAGPRLGALRNIAVAEATGEWVCQWDDDDRYHPMRLMLQWKTAQAESAAVCYLVDQLHWFRPENQVFWDDWDNEPYPMNIIQGSILARRDILPPYPDIACGEDTLQTHALLRAAAETGFGIARLRGAGWCYIYTFHGTNVWEETHHRAISALKHMVAARLLPRLRELRPHLAEYWPRLPALHMHIGADSVRLTEDCAGPGGGA